MIVIYPGSFDPFTFGHYDIVYRALKMGIDKVIIAVMSNSKKQTSRTVMQRIEIVRGSIEYLKVEGMCINRQVEIVGGSGKTVADLVKEYGASAILKGVRNSLDFEDEKVQALVNFKYFNDLDTILLPTLCDEISSSTVRELVKYGKRDAWKGMICGGDGVYKLVEKYYGN